MVVKKLRRVFKSHQGKGFLVFRMVTPLGVGWDGVGVRWKCTQAMCPPKEDKRVHRRKDYLTNIKKSIQEIVGEYLAKPIS